MDSGLESGPWPGSTTQDAGCGWPTADTEGGRTGSASSQTECCKWNVLWPRNDPLLRITHNYQWEHSWPNSQCQLLLWESVSNGQSNAIIIRFIFFKISVENELRRMAWSEDQIETFPLPFIIQQRFILLRKDVMVIFLSPIKSFPTFPHFKHFRCKK